MESIHPALVHFPIALLVTAFLFETLALAMRRPAWHRISLWNLGLGTLGAGVAVLTGRMAETVAKHSPEIEKVLEQHERLGYLVLGLALALVGWRLIRRDRLGPRSRWAVWVLLAALCVLVGTTAHLGGRLVYEFGVGGSYGHRSQIEVVE